MCTATAGINTGTITPNTTYKCTGAMDYYGTIFHCWKRSGHGIENLSDAVRDSCNIYFYNVGIKTGIDALTKTAKDYGLGTATGIELNESIGVNAGPAYSEKIGSIWNQGNVLSAAIGQSDNQFSPLQLANYIATFINGGSHYKGHLLKTVKSNDNSKILYQYNPSVMNKVKLNKSARSAIKTGMGEVIEADSITDFKDLEDSGIKVGCKTGTAQIGKTGLYNGLFVSFAPYDDPKIAVCTVVEKATSGASTASITAAIMDYYFSEDATLERVEAENQLIS
jgi:penicillin-binding protein 2